MPLSLSFGCGLKKIPQTIGMDIQPLSGVDIVADGFGSHLPFRSETFSEVQCIHVLEHAQNLVEVMEEIHRVLQPGGRVHIVAPHGGTLRFLGDPTHKTAITCTTFNYFLPEYHYNFYGKARFRVEGIDLDLNGDSDSESRGGMLRWLWKRRMWQMEKFLVFLGMDFGLDVWLKKAP